METKELQQSEDKITDTVETLSEDQQTELVKNELAIIPEEDRKEIMKVVKTADIVLIDSHKKKIRSFKARFPAKKYSTENIVFTKEALEKATEQWREVKNYRTKTAEPAFKELKAPHVAITKFYNEQCTPIIEDLKLIEGPISKYIDKLEALEKDEKEKEKNRLAALTNERRDKFMAAGMEFDGDHYVIGSEEFEVPQTSFDMADIQSMTDKIFEGQLAIVTEKNETITRLTAEKKQKDADAEIARKEEERLAKEKFDNEQAELKRQQEEFQKAQADLKRQQDELAEQQRKLKEEQEKEEQRKQIQEQARIQNIIDARNLQLSDLGLNYSTYTSTYDFNNEPFVKIGEVNGILPEQEWQALIDKITPVIAERKEAIRQKDLAAIKTRQEVEAKLKKEEEERIAAKAIEDKRLFDLAEEKRKAEELALKGDKAVWEDFISRLKAISFPQMKSDSYGSRVSTVKQFIDNLK